MGPRELPPLLPRIRHVSPGTCPCCAPTPPPRAPAGGGWVAPAPGTQARELTCRPTTLKGSAMWAKHLSRRSRARQGSFSSIQPTANMLWGQRSEVRGHAGAKPSTWGGETEAGGGRAGAAVRTAPPIPLQFPYPGHGRAPWRCHSLINLQVLPANVRTQVERDGVTQEHDVRLLHLLSWGGTVLLTWVGAGRGAPPSGRGRPGQTPIPWEA